MNKAIINLEEYRTEGAKVITGRDRGQDIRKRTKIDKLFEEYDMVEIIIPSDIRSLNPSFLEEFLFNVVKKLGKEAFWAKVTITNKSDKYIHTTDFEEAIDRILRDHTALSKNRST